MIVLVAIVLVLLPAAAMVYPFLRKRRLEVLEDESTPQAELARRWEAALAGLRTAELEWALGNLVEENYRWLRQRYMTEAAGILKAMDLEYQQEEELLTRIAQEVEAVRRQAFGIENQEPSSDQTPQSLEGPNA